MTRCAISRLVHRQQTVPLFDHFVGAGQKRKRHRESEYPCGLGVDNKLELARLHDRHVCWLRALDDVTGIDADLTISIRQTRSVAHQTADFNKLAHPVYRGDRVARCQMGQLDTPASEKRAAADEKGIGLLAHKSRECRIDPAAGIGGS
jgi:hypothetical protein